MPASRTRDKLRELERLDQKVDGAALHRADGFGDPAEPGHHDRQDLGIAGERVVEHLHAVGIRQPEVDDERVVGERLEAFDRFARVGGLSDLESIGAERLRNQLSEIRFVIDNQDGGVGRAGHKAAASRHPARDGDPW